ncbi:MAG: hypothetical protein H0X35_14210 [Pseudonocardiales bacterium]|nr:hypothetical protein [Pseudonocardiales bacterium]
MFLTAATLGLAVSLLPPATAADGATTWWLEAMHLAVFAGLAPALARTLPRALPRANTPGIGLAVAPGPS